MRLGEGLALQPEDLDCSSETIRIGRAFSEDGTCMDGPTPFLVVCAEALDLLNGIHGFDSEQGRPCDGINCDFVSRSPLYSST